jgi:demethylspheroidene O-methyltransferase
MSAPDSAISVADATSRSATPASWLDRLLDWRNAIYASPGFQRWSAAFPLTRPIALRRARAVFDLCAGFIYSQTLTACFQLDLFKVLAAEALTAAELSRRVGLPPEGMERLLRAALSLKLVERRSGGRYALGPLGAPLVNNDGLAALVAHHHLAYADLRDPVSLLRRDGVRTTELANYWAYADKEHVGELQADSVSAYSELMASSLPPLASDILDAYDFRGVKRVMDVGGGEGVFLSMLGAAEPGVALTLFDLPPVAERAQRRMDAAGLSSRTTVTGGNFHADALPTGADVITLIRVLLDHDDASVRGLLARVRAALPKGGRLLIAEAFAGVKGAEPVGDAYFGFYLLAMGRGRARSVDELKGLLHEAGFGRVRVLRTRYPFQTGLLEARS